MPVVKPTLKNGSSGDAVKELQNLLNAQGYHLDTDGFFGKNSDIAVRDFQAKHQLLSDGVVGTNTWNLLLALKKNPDAVPKSLKTPSQQFLETYGPMAGAAMKKTKVPASVTLSQAILESGWGKYAVGNNFFGIKADSSWTGLRQLIRTREVLRKANAVFPEVISVTNNGDGSYTYIVKDWFRAYATAEESFVDHGNFFIKNTRYKKAFDFSNDGNRFAEEIAKAGYATDPNYANALKGLIRQNNLLSFDVTV